MITTCLIWLGLVLFAVLAFGAPILVEMYGDERGRVLPREDEDG